MRWMSNCHSLVPGVRHLCRGTIFERQGKAFGLLLALSALISLVPCRPAAHAEDSAAERKLISRVEPEYPETLQRLYIGGVVRLELTISAKGDVEHAILLGGNPILGQSAMAAVRKWKYASTNSRSVTQVKIPFDPHR
jgi:TonB family protein